MNPEPAAGQPYRRRHGVHDAPHKNQTRKTKMKIKYRYLIGTPSWHQARAGHSHGGEIIAEHTPEEHALFVARYRERGERVTFQILHP